MEAQMAQAALVQKTRVHDWANLMLGLGLFASPWVYGYSATTSAAVTAWANGAIIMLVAALALWRFAEWEEWVEMALGAWTMAAPFAIGFKAGDLALQAFEIVGVLLVASSIWKLWALHHPDSDELLDQIRR
jgi:SPW repeat